MINLLQLWQTFVSWLHFNPPQHCMKYKSEEDKTHQDFIRDWVLLEIAGITFNNYGDFVETDKCRKFSDIGGFGIEEILNLIFAAEEYFHIEIPDRYILHIKTTATIEDFIQLIYTTKYIL